MSKYVWCEDGSAGFEFWKEVFAIIHSDMTVLTKNGISDLRKDAERIADDGNEYYLLYDCPMDNNDVLREVKRLKIKCEEKRNVNLLGFHSFEFVLLSFSQLDSWLFEEDDELKTKRSDLLAIKDKFVRLMNGEGDSGDLLEIKDYLNYSADRNTEQIAARLLRDITRNTGFYTDKGHLGNCFVNDCCSWEEKESDDKCGLNNNFLEKGQKIKELVKDSIICETFQKAGL